MQKPEEKTIRLRSAILDVVVDAVAIEQAEIALRDKAETHNLNLPAPRQGHVDKLLIAHRAASGLPLVNKFLRWCEDIGSDVQIALIQPHGPKGEDWLVRFQVMA